MRTYFESFFLWATGRGWSESYWAANSESSDSLLGSPVVSTDSTPSWFSVRARLASIQEGLFSGIMYQKDRKYSMCCNEPNFILNMKQII